ncbi:hypothetical protein F2Q69_00057314 [Brassica cretica]|uniref:Uncharacterized protein n=1 Tax=Brassica cretica TaxID=69181 RepID=A0A8S9N528_BRACR|nr:hypothetical protein F2Q69_00057314 [Brassica cretica]
MDDAATVNPARTAPASSNHQIETLGAELSANANNCQTRGASVEEESLAVSNKISIESETVKAADSNKQEAQPVKTDAFLSNLSAKAQGVSSSSLLNPELDSVEGPSETQMGNFLEKTGGAGAVSSSSVAVSSDSVIVSMDLGKNSLLQTSLYSNEVSRNASETVCASHDVSIAHNSKNVPSLAQVTEDSDSSSRLSGGHGRNDKVANDSMTTAHAENEGKGHLNTEKRVKRRKKRRSSRSMTISQRLGAIDKTTADIDLGILDALEVATKVAQEVAREVDSGEASQSSSDEELSDESGQSGSQDSHDDELHTGSPSKRLSVGESHSFKEPHVGDDDVMDEKNNKRENGMVTADDVKTKNLVEPAKSDERLYCFEPGLIDSNLRITIEKMDDAATVNPARTAPASSNHQIETLGAELSANANNCQTRGASVEEESLAVSNKISIESETVKAADSNKQEAQPVKPDAFLSNLSAKAQGVSSSSLLNPELDSVECPSETQLGISGNFLEKTGGAGAVSSSSVAVSSDSVIVSMDLGKNSLLQTSLDSNEVSRNASETVCASHDVSIAHNSKNVPSLAQVTEDSDSSSRLSGGHGRNDKVANDSMTTAHAENEGKGHLNTEKRVKRRKKRRSSRSMTISQRLGAIDKTTADIDLGILDALEVATKVAQEVAREVDSGEASQSSSDEELSDESGQSGSQDSHDDELHTGSPSKRLSVGESHSFKEPHVGDDDVMDEKNNKRENGMVTADDVKTKNLVSPSILRGRVKNMISLPFKFRISIPVI